MEERNIFEKWYKQFFHNGRKMNFHIAKFHLVPKTMTRTRIHSHDMDEEEILKSSREQNTIHSQRNEDGIVQ